MSIADVNKTIVIGDIRVSPALYNIFVDEAGSHLATMRRELAALAEEPQPPRDEFVRAAHTLAGIAGTVNFAKLHELGRAFELMLVAAMGTRLPLAEADAALAGRSVDALEGMVVAVCELREPPTHPALQKLLEGRRAELSSAAEEAPEPMLASFELPVVAAAEASAELPEVDQRTVAPAFPAEGLQIDFGALADTVREQAEPTVLQAPSSDFTLDMGALAAVSQAAPPAAAIDQPLETDTSFHIESLSLPPAEVMPTPLATPDDAPAPLAFIDAVAPAAPSVALAVAATGAHACKRCEIYLHRSTWSDFHSSSNCPLRISATPDWSALPTLEAEVRLEAVALVCSATLWG